MSQLPPSRPVRPLGITILALLSLIGGLLSLCTVSVALATLLGLSAGLSGVFNSPAVGVAGGIISVFLVAGMVLSTLLSFAFAFGAWYLKPWAWTLGIAVEAISLITVVFNLLNGSKFSSQILPIAIAGFIIFYLFTPEVKRAFGRS